MSVTITGILTMVLTHFLGEVVPAEDVATFLNVAGFIVGAIVAWYGRVRAGGVSFWGIKE